MNITELLKESFQPEQASLIESAIAKAIESQVEAKLTEAKADSATAQAKVAQKSAEDIENISAIYDSEMKKAAKEIVKLEKFYNKQINIAVDKIVTAYDDAERTTAHYHEQLKEAAELYIRETDQGSLSELKQEVSEYVAENAKLIEQAQSYGEYAYQEGLAEAQSLVEDATAIFIKENQEKFDRLDEMARLEKIIVSIKEAYEINALGLSEDTAYNTLKESVETKTSEIEELQETVSSLKTQLFENKKLAEFERLTKNLSETQKDKLKDVSDAIIAEDINVFSRTLGFLIEAQTPSQTTKNLNENIDTHISIENNLNENKNQEAVDDFVKSLTSRMI